MIKYLIPMCCVFALIAACDLTRDIDINLPEYNSEIVVESYVETGLPLRALVTESISYTDLPSPTPLDENTPVVVSFGGQELPTTLSGLAALIGNDTIAQQQFEGFKSAIELLGLISNATVTITHNGTTHMLEEAIYFDFDSGKVYNYGNPFIVPADYDNDFSVEVNSGERTATATARLLAPIEFDSLKYTFNVDTLASIQAWFTDDMSMENHYRFLLHGKNLQDTTYQDGTFNDRFFNGDPIPLGSDFSFEIGDTAIISLYHIEESYHDFVETYEEAFFANGNPFAQPAQILTNVEGGLGIFAALSLTRDTVIVE